MDTGMVQQARKDRRKATQNPAVPNDRRKAERRVADRVPIEMWVEETTDRELYFQRSGNLSAGGIFLENTVPHPVGTVVNLQFTLPGDSLAIKAKGEIVNNADGKMLGMGIKFVDLEEGTRRRIERFIAEHAGKKTRPNPAR